jgi:hypothetical protein
MGITAERMRVLTERLTYFTIPIVRSLITVLLLTVSTTVAADAPPRALIGSVVIERGSGPRPFVLVAVDELGPGGQGDGRIDYIYKFYAPDLPANLHVSYAMAHVDDLDQQLVISAPIEKTRFTFALAGTDPAPHPGDTSYVFTGGSELKRQWGTKVHRGELRKNGPVLYVGCLGGEDGTPCYNDYGDPSASGGGCDTYGCPSACSMAKSGVSCSVTCQPGSCACCSYGGVLGDPQCGCIPKR